MLSDVTDLLEDALDKEKATKSNIHPGEAPLEEFLEPMGVSQNKLAREISVPLNRINAIVNGQRSITADTALRLARHFGTGAEFWLGLQMEYDLEEAALATGDALTRMLPGDSISRLPGSIERGWEETLRRKTNRNPSLL